MSKECGLYKSTQPIPAGEDFVEAPRLVYYHNHSKQGDSMVILPDANVNNVWSFGDKGFLVNSDSFIEGLEPMKPQGVYWLREHFHPNEDQVVNKHAVVQLGYNALAEPILFFPSALKDGNGLEFPVSGMKVSQAIYDLLEPLDLKGPYVPEQKHIH